MKNQLSSHERNLILFILIAVILLVGFDLFTDSREGAVWWHLAAEGSVGMISAIGIFYILRDSFAIRHELENEKKNFNQFRIEADQYKQQTEKWKSESNKYIKGLSLAIDDQLSRWNLSVAEKEVALLLLKGLSLKEIAAIRNTTEKTARIQSTAIYEKAGLGGRSELAAFFLEDLLLPTSSEKN